jgi:hypothetical protein
MQHIRAYITSCHVCQLHKQKPDPHRAFEKRININERALGKISMDIKYMPNSSGGYKFVLLLLCEVTNYLVAVPLRTTQAQEVCKAITKSFIAYFGTPRMIISDMDSSFLSTLTRYFFQQTETKHITVSPTNHQSLLAEFAIKSLSKNITVHLEGFGKNWPDILPWAMLCFNSYATPNLDNHCPLELLLGTRPKILPEYEIKPEIPVTGSYSEYHTKLKIQLEYMRKRIQSFRDKRHDILNKNRKQEGFLTGQLVYMHNPKGARLQTGTRKFMCEWVGPLCIYKALSPSSFVLMTLTGALIPHIIEIGRIKPGYIKGPQGNISSLAGLKAILRAGIRVDL